MAKCKEDVLPPGGGWSGQDRREACKVDAGGLSPVIKSGQVGVSRAGHLGAWGDRMVALAVLR